MSHAILGCPDGFAPRAHRRGAKRAVGSSGREVALDVESVGDDNVRGQNFLRGACALEALHLAFPPSGRLMRILDTIVLPPPAFVSTLDPEILNRCTV
jgi:hypothetical protein